jgi:hypothetical protein
MWGFVLHPLYLQLEAEMAEDYHLKKAKSSTAIFDKRNILKPRKV